MSCINKTLKIYLAGKMSGLNYEQMNDWRVSLTNRLNVAAENAGYKLVIINPVLFYNFEERVKWEHLKKNILSSKLNRLGNFISLFKIKSFL